METLFPDKKVTADDAIVWRGDALYLLDQRLLPGKVQFMRLATAAQTAAAIRDMVVRGAPAIGITAAYGVVLSVLHRGAHWREWLHEDLQQLAAARPTAVNLFWALRRMQRLADTIGADDAAARLLQEAQLIHQEDIAANRRIGELGAALLQQHTYNGHAKHQSTETQHPEDTGCHPFLGIGHPAQRRQRKARQRQASTQSMPHQAQGYRDQGLSLG